jgi:cell division protein FtsI (penicillin-binding protein 3)
MKRDATVPFGGRRIIAEKTSGEIRQLMRLVVESGTGKSANVPGYLVGGKTGTAEKQRGRGYAANARLASFIAAFPMNAPRYAILIMVDEPKPNATSHGYATAGWVAAPAVGRVIQRMAPLLGIEPIPERAPVAETERLVPASATE